jgi:hypothetical protein
MANGILCRGPTQATLNPPSPPNSGPPARGNHSVAAAVYKPLPHTKTRQRVVTTAQKAQADILLHCASTTRYRGGTPRRRGAMRKTSELHSAAQATGHGLTATSMPTRGALASTEWADRHIRARCAAPAGWRRRLCARPCCVYFFPAAREGKSAVYMFCPAPGFRNTPESQCGP